MNRSQYIGSSDADDLLKGRFLKVWLEKTGRAERENLDDKFHVQLGKLTEPFHIDWTIRRLIEEGKPVTRTTYDGKPVPGPMPYIASKPDGAILFDGRKVPVETKHSNGATTMEKQVELYMPQIQHHLLCTKADRLLFSVIFGNTEPERVWVGPSAEWLAAMLDAYARFWHHMETDTRPEGGAFSDVIMPSADSVPVNATVKRDASTDNQFMALAHDYIANEGAAKVYEAAKKDLKALMKKDEREVYSPILTMKRNKAGSIGFTVNVAAPIAAAAE